MKNSLVLPLVSFEKMIHLLSEERSIYFPVGISKVLEENQYLFRGKEITLYPPKYRKFFKVCSINKGEKIIAKFEEDEWGNIIFEKGSSLWWGSIRDEKKQILPLNTIKVIGPKMPFLYSSDFFEKNKPTDSSKFHKDREILWDQYSRSIVALGQETWERLRMLKFAIVGCGRSGSIAAINLAKLGVSQIFLLDPDTLEIHNLPEMDGVGFGNIGQSKVEALKSFITGICPSTTIFCFTGALPAEFKKVLPADILISCVDNDAARLASAILSTFYHKVLLDIGTGIFREENKKRRMGADIRLILPGDSCLVCMGGLVQQESAIQQLANLTAQSRNTWWIERSGSLRTLNAIAINIGIQLLLDFLEGRVSHSRWIALEYDEEGNISFQKTEKKFSSECHLCSQSGFGDEALGWGRTE